MKENLERLVNQANSEIDSRAQKRGIEKSPTQLPKFSSAAVIWFAFVVLMILESETIVGLVVPPAENKIERDLEHILDRAADSLEHYETLNGDLPPILPNPAIRGLVKYNRKSDFEYTLTATIGGVTMVKTSSGNLPYRKDSP